MDSSYISSSFQISDKNYKKGGLSYKFKVFSKFLPNPSITLFIRNLENGKIINKLRVSAFIMLKDIPELDYYLSISRPGILTDENDELVWQMNPNYFTFLSKELYIYEIFPFINENSFNKDDYAFIDVSNDYYPDFSENNFKIKVVNSGFSTESKNENITTKYIKDTNSFDDFEEYYRISKESKEEEKENEEFDLKIENKNEYDEDEELDDLSGVEMLSILLITILMVSGIFAVMFKTLSINI